MHPLYANMPVSFFERMSMLAIQHRAVNLGQGFPDFGWPEPILQRASRALVEESNQYPPSRGVPELRQAVAEHYQRHFRQPLDAEGICVTSGATEARRTMWMPVMSTMPMTSAPPMPATIAGR